MEVKGQTRSSGNGMESRSQSGSPVEIPVPVKRREPKFVPYEPYKAAVNPIVPSWDKGTKHRHHQAVTELLETHIPFPLKARAKGENVPVIRVLRRMHSDQATVAQQPASALEAAEQVWEHQKQSMELEIKKLKDEKRDIENQFRIQTKVNADLKKLLVASLGEDVQTKVQFLSEDKARLAQDIACYSQLIQEEHEELEKLAIQCDIWRSKFLASSMMVDELAQWKAVLSRKYEESKEAIQWMLQEHQDIGQTMSATHRYLNHLQSSFDPSLDPKSKMVRQPCDLLKLSKKNQKLGESVHFRLLGSAGVKADRMATPWPDEPTPAEEFAQKVLMSKDMMVENLCNQEKDPSWHFSSGKGPFLFHSHFRSDQVTVNCCKQCSGEIDLI